MHSDPAIATEDMKTFASWMIALISAIAGAVIFLYVTFETKDQFADYRADQIHYEQELTKRLDRIEDKLDRLRPGKR